MGKGKRAVLLGAAGALTMLGAPVAHAATPGPAAALERSVPAGPVVMVGANKSNNWSGYNQGALTSGAAPFTQVSGTWVVPTASAHSAGTAAASATWVGIGGGCANSSCSVTDQTLIQTGTSQDVSASGKATYSAWWEVIPAPSVTIAPIAVHPGDTVHANIIESLPGLWTISLEDTTDGQSFTMQVPYASTGLSAEWIEETPVVAGTGGAGIGPLPELSTVHFTQAMANRAPANLAPSQEMQLVGASGQPLMTPSAPGLGGTAFNDCAYASSCTAP